MSKTQNRLNELAKQISALQHEQSTLQVKAKKKKGVLQYGEAYVVTYEEDGKEQHCVYYCGADVVCLNRYSDVSTSFCSEMLEEVEKFAYECGKVSGKKMSLAEAIKYL